MTYNSVYKKRSIVLAHEALENELRDQIAAGTLLPGAMLPSRRTLGREHGVSTGTVDRAIANLLAEGLIRTDSRRGTFVADGAPPSTASHFGALDSVGLLFCNTSEFPQANYLCGVRSGLPDEVHLLLCDTRNDARREAQYFERMQAIGAGIICYPTCDPTNTELIRRAVEAGCRIVCLDRYPAELKVDALVTNNYEATRKGIEFLIERGHRRIACFTVDNESITTISERNGAYRDAMVESGSDPKRWLRAYPYLSRSDESSRQLQYHDSLFTMLHQKEPPTAAFCINDSSLRCLIEACDMLGLSLPDNLEVLSFSDRPQPNIRIRRSVHRIVQQAYEMGLEAARCLQSDCRAAAVTRVPAHFYEAIFAS